MIRRPCHIKSLETPKDIAQLDKQLDMLFAAANYNSTGGVPGGGGGGGTGGNIWSTASRPARPSIGLSRGYNTDFNGEEVYTAFGWLVIFGTWTVAGRPAGVAAGSQGFNIDSGSREYKFGSNDTDWNTV